MHPLAPLLACYSMGLALLWARGGERDPLLASALALPVGAAASALLVLALVAVGVPFQATSYGLAWGALLAAATFASRRAVRRLWPWPAVVGAAVAVLGVAAARVDVAVLTGASHDVLLMARAVASRGELPAGAPETSALATFLLAAVALVSPDRVHAFAPALGLSVLAALALLVARVVDHPRRTAIILVVMIASATSFPLLRSLLTVGSPGLAGGMLLLFGGLWYVAELVRDPRLLPIALLALAAFALHAPSFALAAALCAAVVAAPTPLWRGAFPWRIRVLEAPGARLAVASGLAAAVPAAAGQAAAGALAAAPLGLLALTALAVGRRTAEPEPARPRDSIATRDDLDALLVSGVAAAVVVGLIEWGMLFSNTGDLFDGAGQAARLLPLGVGNLLPYALAAASVLAIACVAERRAEMRWRWSGLWIACAAAALSLPYAIWLARYAFSGPQAQATAHRSLLTVLAAVAVALGFAAAVWFAAFRRRNRRFAPAALGALLAGSAAATVMSGVLLRNEYRPLHQFLAVWSVLFAALAGRELVSLARARVARRRRLAPVLAVAALVWSGGAGIALARADADAWLVWGETGASRYLTRRWQFFAPPVAAPPSGERMLVRPDLESSRTGALRAARAAAPAPNIVLFSIDGLRQDRVGAYGYTRRRLTPNIDRFAARGVRFTRAVSSFPTTQVFNSALLLGRYLDRAGQLQQPPGFRATAVTNLLKDRHYHVFVKGWFDQFLRKRFDPRPYRFDTYAPKATSGEELEEPMEQGLSRLALHLDSARERDTPVFVWIHLVSTHPMTGRGFVAHPDFDFGDSPMDRYESAVAGADRWLGGVEELVATRLDPARPTAWFLFSDHGVNQHTRSRDLHGPIVRVPYIVVAPDVAPGVDDRLIDVSIDTAATVLDLAGIEPPRDYDGVSLMPLLAGLPADSLAERIVPLAYTDTWAGAIHGHFKVLWSGDAMSLYDVGADPGETRNIVARAPARAWAMREVAGRELERRFRAAAQARGGEVP